uniref:Uncharacterized protein n=1 Tax=viral metagenome TaxID=1070528 RepID=A0A6M3JIM2_9ZZZZ
MNRLKDTRCYLSGAIENDSTPTTWRGLVKHSLSDLKICWLDPTCKPTTEAIETPETFKLLKQLRAMGDYDGVEKIMHPIRCVDLRMTDIADFLIVRIDPEVPTFGTHEEIANANRQKKPILVTIEGGKKKTPFWILGMIPHQMVFDNLSEIFAYLRAISSGYDVHPMDRWCFFDWSKTR